MGWLVLVAVPPLVTRVPAAGVVWLVLGGLGIGVTMALAWGLVAAGQLAELDKIDIDIKFKHMLRLQYLREQALNNAMITEEQKGEE